MSTAAQAQIWVKYAVDNRGLRSSYDSSSVRRVGSVVRLWVKKDRSGVVGNTYAHESRERLEIDCNAETLTILNAVDYDAAGDVAGQEDIRGRAFSPAPGSTGRTLLETACR